MATLILSVLFSCSGAYANGDNAPMAGPTHGLVSNITDVSGMPTLKSPDFSYFQPRSFLIKLCVSIDEMQNALDTMEPERYRAAPFPLCSDDGKATLMVLNAALDRVFEFAKASDGRAIVGPTSRLLALGLGTDTKGTDSPNDDVNGLLQLAVYTLAPAVINQALGVSDVACAAAITWRIEANSGLGTNRAFYSVAGDDGFAVDIRLDWPIDPSDERAPLKSEVRKGAGSPRIHFAGNRRGGPHPSIEFEYVRNRLDIRPQDFTVEVTPADRGGLPEGDISISKILGASVGQNQETLIKVFPDDAP